MSAPPDPACRICTAPLPNGRIAVPEMMFGTRELFDFALCSGCGTLQIAAIPADIARHYPPGAYYSFNNARALSPLRRLAKRALAGWLAGRPHRWPAGESWRDRLLRGVQPWIALVPGLHRGSAILDVGCGEAARLRQLAALGFRELAGMDPFLPPDRAGRTADGIALHACELPQHDGAHDLVMFHHSLEHMADPAAQLAAARARLKPGGQVLVRVPVLQPGIWQRYGTNWAQIDAPRHLHLFTPHALIALAQRAGLEPVSMTCDGEGWALAWSEAIAGGLPLRAADGSANPAPFTEARLEQFAREARRLNRAGEGDQACFVFRPA